MSTVQKASNAIVAAVQFYGDALAEQFKVNAATAQLLEQEVKSCGALRVQVTAMLVDRQLKAKQVLALLTQLDDGSDFGSPAAKMRELLEVMASEQTAMPAVMKAK